MIFCWHFVIACMIWLWIVRGKQVEVLQRYIPCVFTGAAVASAVATAVPILNHNLGLWSESECFVRRAWSGPNTPAPGLLIDRMVLLPGFWLAILVFNFSTVRRLRAETQRFYAVSSVKRLQLRLVLITFAFVLIWIPYSIPFYLKKRSFELELAVKWGYGIGFIDATIFGACIDFILICRREGEKSMHGGKCLVPPASV